VVVQVVLLFILCRGVTRAFWGGLDRRFGGGLGSNNPPTRWHSSLGELGSNNGGMSWPRISSGIDLCDSAKFGTGGFLDSSSRLGELGSNNGGGLAADFGGGGGVAAAAGSNRLGGLDSSLGSRLGGSVKEGTSGIGLGIFHYVMLCYY